MHDAERRTVAAEELDGIAFFNSVMLGVALTVVLWVVVAILVAVQAHWSVIAILVAVPWTLAEALVVRALHPTYDKDAWIILVVSSYLVAYASPLILSVYRWYRAGPPDSAT